MIESIQVGFQAIQGGLNIAQGIQSLKTETAVNQAVIDIQRSLLDAQKGLNEAEARHSSDLARIDELEQETMRLKDWSTERERYELIGIRGGAFAYMPKAGMENGEPAHWLCTNCFEHGQKSIMQNKGQQRAGSGDETYGCNRCKASFNVMGRVRPAYQRSE